MTETATMNRRTPPSVPNSHDTMAGLLSSTSGSARSTPPSGVQMMTGSQNGMNFNTNMNSNMASNMAATTNNGKSTTNNNNTSAINNMNSGNHPITAASASSTPGQGAKACSGCGDKIMDRFLLLAMDRYWHTACLKCSFCHAHLGDLGQSCFAKNGMILCKNDYLRMFVSGGSCSLCCQPIPASELVMKAQGNVYHLKCFTCVTCNCQLRPGDRYSILNGSLVCEQDYPRVLKGQTLLPQRTLHKVC